MRILMRMATKNVYVSDSDLPLFEHAAELAGGMSAAVAAALQLYVTRETRERKLNEMNTIELQVQEGPLVTTKRFTGRQILRYQIPDGLRTQSFRVYRTARGQYAVYTRSEPNWSKLSSPEENNPVWEDPHTWNTGWWKSDERSLRVFADLDAMHDDLPAALVTAITNAHTESVVEDLDI